jgi:hypothetical protein
MVRWYDPGNLIRSAKEILLSTLISKHADQRRIVGHGSDRPRFFDTSNPSCGTSKIGSGSITWPTPAMDESRRTRWLAASVRRASRWAGRPATNP